MVDGAGGCSWLPYKHVQSCYLSISWKGFDSPQLHEIIKTLTMRKLEELVIGTNILCNGYAEYKSIKRLMNSEVLDRECSDLWKQYSANNKIIYNYLIGTYYPKRDISECVKASEFLPKKEFPKEWTVQNDGSQRFKDTVVRYINTFWIKGEDLRAYYGWIDNRWQVVGSLQSRVSLLTLDEFEEILNNQKSKEMAKEISGYKCPMNMWNAKDGGVGVLKGDLFVKSGTGTLNYVHHRISNTFLPKELVESWEPVYEDKKIIVPGSSYEVVIVSRNTTMIDGNEFKRSFWASALDVSMHSKAEVKIGCSKQFTLNQAWIESVLDAMERMN